MVREAKQQPTATDFISRGLTHNHARKNSTTASAVHGTVAACIPTHMQSIRRTWRPKNRRTRHTGREGSVASIGGGLGPGVRKILRIAALVQSAMLSARLAASLPVIRSPVTIRQRLSTRHSRQAPPGHTHDMHNGASPTGRAGAQLHAPPRVATTGCVVEPPA
jgi:hypothetical protein